MNSVVGRSISLPLWIGVVGLGCIPAIWAQLDWVGLCSCIGLSFLILVSRLSHVRLVTLNCQVRSGSFRLSQTGSGWIRSGRVRPGQFMSV